MPRQIVSLKQLIHDDLPRLRQSFFEELQRVDERGLKPQGHSLLEIKAKYLGPKGQVRDWVQSIRTLSSPEERAQAGQQINALKQELEEAYQKQEQKFRTRKAITLDTTLPGRKLSLGRLHPLTLTLREMTTLFHGLGFEVVEGPEIETDYYNFEALNIPATHPARDGFDTIYVDVRRETQENKENKEKEQKGREQGEAFPSPSLLLRTHTSPVQIRVMEKRQPPLRILAPGRVFREDTPDASHSPIFHQVEGLAVEEAISFKDLKAVLTNFLRSFFAESVEVRFLPSYFPFTEPSAEVEMSCVFCHKKGCSTCGMKGWIEILGAGMVHPQVLRNVGYDPEKYRGFAFGMGVERLAMLKYRINDIRLFLENHLDFLNQFY